METKVCDIEDLPIIVDAAVAAASPVSRGLSKERVAQVRNKRLTRIEKSSVPDPSEDATKDRQNKSFSSKGYAAPKSFIPGTFNVFVKTWGCSHNNSDSEYMRGLLVLAGYQISDRAEDADLWVLNSCTVKTPSEQHLQNQVEQASRSSIPVVVAGCVPQAAPKTAWIQQLSVVGVQQIDRIVEVVEETIKGNCVRLLSTKKAGARRLAGASLTLPKIRKNPLIEILPISTGCLNHCTYCKTKQARGDLVSYTIEEIVERARQAFREGVKEIWLTSEDLGAFGRDQGVTLPELLFQLVPEIPDGCMMRLGMTNPPYILDHLEEIAEILNHPRVYAFLHIPVQSGSDAVLVDMRREYRAKDFREVVDCMLRRVPGISIATDIICGFPTETEEDFEDTLRLVADYRFPSLFINQFYPRPNTPAARMKRIDTVEVKRRTKQVTDLFASYMPYSDLVGSEQRILVTEQAADGCSYVGHTKSYQQVLVEKQPDLMGQMVKVKIVSAGKHYLTGKIAENRLWRKRVLRVDNKYVGLILLTMFTFLVRVFLLNKFY